MKIRLIIKQAVQYKYIVFKNLESFNSKICHATMVIPWANGLFYPVIVTLTQNIKVYKLSPTFKLIQAMQDFTTILKLASVEPIPLEQLIPGY